MRLYNISDHPSFTPVDIKYKKGTIKPGENIQLDPDFTTLTPYLVTDIPLFYVEWKSNKVVTSEYLTKLFMVEVKEEEEKPTKKKK